MSLGSTQREFALDVANLIQRIYFDGYECTFGDAYRDPRSHGKMGDREAYGRAYSAHKQRLAIDLNLFKDGKYLTDTESHRPFGEFWLSVRPGNRWGGTFENPDGNHYSRIYGGIA
jgi:hypothetical protein